MTKKVVAGVLAFSVLGGLAYYSSYLYSSKETQEQRREMEEQEFIDSEKETEQTAQTEQAESSKAEAEEEKQTASTFPDSVHAEISMEPNAETTAEIASPETADISYYLVEEFGYVNIYLADKETIYEYTDIPIDSLPEALQLEICTGKGVASEQQLYDFLENYSS